MLLDEIKKDILKNEGATLNNEFKKANLKSGFMVSIMGYEFITNNIDEAIKKGLEYKEIIKDKKGYYVGFWIDNNIIYVDISKQINNKRDAEKTAKKNMQKAIYNNKTQTSIYLNYDIIFYSLYKKIYKKINNDIMLIDEVFKKSYDTLHDIPSNYRNDTNNYIIYKDYININEL